MAVKTKKKAPEVAAATGLGEYELVLVLKPDLSEEAAEAFITKTSGFVTEKGGTVASVERWGRMRLAYPIKHTLEGIYLLARFTLQPKVTRELEANLRIAEELLRHLLVKKEA